MVRHILKIVREEYVISSKNRGDGLQSLHQIVMVGIEAEEDGYERVIPGLRAAILEHVTEFEVELETSAENIANQASEHIHSNEIILTIGKSNIVEKFLRTAARKRKFQVIVAECAPTCNVSLKIVRNAPLVFTL